MSTDPETIRQAYLTGFRTRWAAYDPAWDLDTRISWPDVTDFKPPSDPYLEVQFEDVGGFNDAVGRLDTQVALFTVDVYVPLARYAASLRGTLGKDIHDIVVALSEATEGRAGNIFFRTFGQTARDEAHGRVVLELEYTLSPAA